MVSGDIGNNNTGYIINAGKTIVMEPSGGNREIAGSLFTVNQNGSLTIQGNTVSGNGLKFKGNNNNTHPLIAVSSGTLIMNSGAVITGNASSINGGGVSITDGGSFTMTGGDITGNTSSNTGGGVYVGDGTFTMTGGSIIGNIASANGGGVAVAASGIFTMSNSSVISANTANGGQGGGVWSGGKFTMSNGTISGNRAAETGSGAKGGGVYIDGTTTSAEFTKSGGEIYGNNAAGSLLNIAENGEGHAVYVARPNLSDSKKKDTTVSYALRYASGTFYEGWEFTVTFIADDGTPAPASVSADYGGKIPQPAAMNKTGYAFAGWYKDAALTNAWNFDTDTVSGDTTLYAKWTFNQYMLTITIALDELQEKVFVEESDKKISYESDFSIPIISGYTVDRWYLDGVKQTYTAGDDVVIRNLNPGIHRVTIIARDSEGYPYSNEMTITVDDE